MPFVHRCGRYSIACQHLPSRPASPVRVAAWRGACSAYWSWDGIAPARGDNCEARSHRSYVRQDVEYPRGLVSVQRPTVGRRNITQFTVAKPQSSCAPDSDALRCARDGAMIYQSVAQRIPPKVGSEPLPPPPPAGSAPALLPRGFRHSEVTSFTEHMRRNPTFRGASALDFYTSGRVI